MNILVSNDDGFFAPGLKSLVGEMEKIGSVTVVAPNKDHSGASNSLTLDRPLIVHKHSSNQYSVNGTPTDCVHLAITGLLENPPDLVVSGINNGANMGEDTIYSGTVAAAMEGFLLGVPSVAFSLTSKTQKHFASAAEIARITVKRLFDQNRRQPYLLNVNIPSVNINSISGSLITRLGRRHKAQGVVKSENPRGQVVYRIGAAGDVKDNSVGTDFDAVEKNFVSITPLKIDLTDTDSNGAFNFLAN